jgi:hypothetical protein
MLECMPSALKTEVIMKIRPLQILLSTVAAMLGLLISDAKACSCMFGGSPPCEEYWRAETVFAGKVTRRSTFYVEEGEGTSRYRYQQVLVSFSIEQTFKGITGEETYLDNVKITVEGNGKRFETATDRDGRYRVSGLAPGKYKVIADVPEGQSSSSQHSVEVVDRGCAASDFYVQANSQISGRVFDEKGNPLPNITVDIIPAEDVQGASPKGKRWSTDDEGRYKFDRIPPGDYYLGVGLAGGRGNLCPYPRVFMPDSRDAKEAKIVSLKEGQKIEDQNISLPSITPDLEFEVEIVWPDGRPAEIAVMLLHGDGPAVHTTGQRDPAGKPGLFRVKTFKACSYWVTAFTSGHPGEPGGGEPRHGEVKVDSSASFTKPIRVTLSQPGFMCQHRRPKD